jgi:hypothetical protein
MSQKRLIHIKIERDSAINSKKQILQNQLRIIKFLKIVEKYKKLRLKELDLKNKLRTRMGALKKDINKIETALPEMEIEEEVEKIKKTTKKKITVQKSKKDLSLEKQLKEIQEKLQNLE